jgi:hypothetical protein
MSGNGWYRRSIEMLATAMFGLGLEWPEDGLKRHYFWPAAPGEGWTVLSSCSGVPVSKGALEAVRALTTGDREFRDLDDMRGWTEDARDHVEESLAIAFEAPAGTRIMLMPTVAEAVRVATIFYWGSLAKDRKLSVVAPFIGDDGEDERIRRGLAGIYAGYGPRDEELRPKRNGKTSRIWAKELPFRGNNGVLASDSAIDDFVFKCELGLQRAGGLSCCVTLGDATGIVGPLGFGDGMVDALQMRVRPNCIGGMLVENHIVVVSGSTFLGGPGESAAVLIPPGLQQGFAYRQVDEGWRKDVALEFFETHPTRAVADVFRWIPAVANLNALERFRGSVDTRLFRMTTQLRELLGEFPDFEVLQGRSEDQIVCCGRDSGLVAFAVKDRHRNHHYLDLPALRELHARLARKKVLLGLPVKAGILTYALRVAVGAEDVLRDDLEASLERLAAALSELGFSRLPGRATEPRPPVSREGAVLH